MKKIVRLFTIILLAISTSFAFAQTAHLKKDGSPDKRYKENKVKPPQGPKKKNGTPDMRYKSNKGHAPVKKKS